MLGKTNINVLTEGTIVTEIKDYRWVQMKAGIFSDFVKAVYKNDYLVAITMDGKVVYTTDGEVWTVWVLEYENCRLHDIDFDGSNFILVGSYIETETLQQKYLIIITSDFISYERKEIISDEEYVDCWAVYPKNGKHIFISQSKTRSILHILLCDLSDGICEEALFFSEGPNVPSTISIAKNSRDIILTGADSDSKKHSVNKISTDTLIAAELSSLDTDQTITQEWKVKKVSTFECKDELYYAAFEAAASYKFAKLLSSGEEMLMSRDINYMFVDGVYFDGCQIFINAHEMLIVKKGENIADKTYDDLIEIAPELTMNCITKAFGQLYIFGNQGVILKSSAEANNDEAIAVQTLSAKRALNEAKIYTDERFVALEARITALEELKGV